MNMGKTKIMVGGLDLDLLISQNSSMGSALGIDRSTPPTGVTRDSKNEPANICQQYIY